MCRPVLAFAILALAVLTASPAAAQPVNDNIQSASPLAPNAPVEVRTSTTVGATPDPFFNLPLTTCSSATSANDVWWYVVPTATGTMTVDLSGSTFDTVLSVYSGPFLNSVGCNDNQAPGILTSRIQNLSVTAGATYRVRVSGNGTATGTVQIALTSTAVTGPPNDRYAPTNDSGTAFTLAGTRLGFNTDATITVGEPSAPAACAPAPGSHSVWWNYFPPTTGFVTIDLTGSAFDTVLIVTNSAGQTLACNDNGGGGTASRIANLPVQATSGGPGSASYFVRVASVTPGATGLIRFTTSFSTTVAGEDGAGSGPGLALGTPRPNPTAGASALTFTLDAAGPARVVLVDALGREVAVLFDGPAPAGETEVRADLSGLPSGVYAARLTAGSGQTAARRLTVVR